MEATILQRIRKLDDSPLLRAERYYAILSIVNDLHLTKRELQLIAFTATKGNISYNDFRKEFCETFKSSSPTINNMISKLKKSNILIKDNNKIKVHPQIQLDFNKPLQLEIKLFPNDV
jgi:DNA-binding GntR family transcriptional regulator